MIAADMLMGYVLGIINGAVTDDGKVKEGVHTVWGAGGITPTVADLLQKHAGKAAVLLEFNIYGHETRNGKTVICMSKHLMRLVKDHDIPLTVDVNELRYEFAACIGAEPGHFLAYCRVEQNWCSREVSPGLYLCDPLRMARSRRLAWKGESNLRNALPKFRMGGPVPAMLLYVKV